MHSIECQILKKVRIILSEQQKWCVMESMEFQNADDNKHIENEIHYEDLWKKYDQNVI